MTNLRVFICLVLYGLLPGQRSAFSQVAQENVRSFPDTAWTQCDPVKLGWSLEKLNQAKVFFDSLPPASLLVVSHGFVVVQWGDPALRVKISSMRKSLLSALFGIYVSEGQLNLDNTLAELKIDDEPPLTGEEKKATIRQLLEARSGVYHSYVSGTPAMRTAMPARGSHPAGTFWFYNNWDFNVLGGIFERQTHNKIGEAFLQRIALPLQMQDFRAGDQYYLSAAPDAPEYARSFYPAYHFRMTARDLARFGYLFLQHGNWNGTQIVPAAWIAKSTQSYSDAGDGMGYGYLWWVNGYSLPVKSFSAIGALGKYLIVIPEKELVIVYLNHTEFPDNIRGLTDQALKNLPTITASQLARLSGILISAQP